MLLFGHDVVHPYSHTSWRIHWDYRSMVHFCCQTSYRTDKHVLVGCAASKQSAEFAAVEAISLQFFGEDEVKPY